MKYASVIVDLSACQVDQAFTYSIPGGLMLEPGQQVAVPFGKRRLEGFVISVQDECDLDPGRVKPILGIVREYPIIMPELMELAGWMCTRYNCRMVDALRLMIPVGMRSGRIKEKQVRMARLAISDDEAGLIIQNERRAPARAKIVKALLDGDRETSGLNSQALRSLVKAGAVELYLQESRRVPKVLDGDLRREDFLLTQAQARAVNEIESALDAGGGCFLLNGVTGSGKTEVYIRIIRRCLEKGKSAIVLVPEIALTPQMVGWFHERFGSDAAVIHSGLSEGERYDEWRRLRFGQARVAIGARSAVFAPLENIGAIIVDEEHEQSYQSDRQPRYDAREVARRRIEMSGGVLVLGSATPSISSYMRTMPGTRPENKLVLIELRERVNRRPLPKVDVVDMRSEFARGNSSIFSVKLIKELKTCFSEGHQAVMFINRRGFATFVSCKACGHVIKCDNCDVSMTYHRDINKLICHYCGSERPAPSRCPQCGSRFIDYNGLGTQRLEEEFLKYFPDKRTVRVDSDTTRAKDSHARLLDTFRSGEADVLIGTQMIAKGLDFPNVTLVGVVSADSTLNLPDYRSSERTFQLITQVAGRAGRAEFPGKVVVQTYSPDNYAIKCAAKQDFRAFYGEESAFRRASLYPPFTTIMRLIYTAKKPEDAEKAALCGEEKLKKYLDAGDLRRDVVQMRALEAPIKYLRGESRWQIFLKMYFKGDIPAVTRFMQDLAEEAPDGVRAELEVNPSNMF